MLAKCSKAFGKLLPLTLMIVPKKCNETDASINFGFASFFDAKCLIIDVTQIYREYASIIDAIVRILDAHI